MTMDMYSETRPAGAALELGTDEWATIETTAEPLAASAITATVQGPTQTVEIPSGAVTDTTTLVSLALGATDDEAPPDLAVAGHALDLDAYLDGSLLPGFTFGAPVTFTLHNADSDVLALREGTLTLKYWDESAGEWEDAASTCAQLSTYDRHLEENWLVVPVCHLSRFAPFGEGRTI